MAKKQERPHPQEGEQIIYVRLPYDVIRAIDDLSEQQDRSRTNMLAVLVKDALNAQIIKKTGRGEEAKR